MKPPSASLKQEHRERRGEEGTSLLGPSQHYGTWLHWEEMALRPHSLQPRRAGEIPCNVPQLHLTYFLVP